MLELSTTTVRCALAASLLTLAPALASANSGGSAGAAIGSDAPPVLDCGAAPPNAPRQRVLLDEAIERDTAEGDARIARLDRLETALRTARYRGGRGTRVECFGNDPLNLDRVTWLFRLEQLERVGTLSGEQTLTAFEERYAVHDPGDDRRVADVLVAEAITLPERGQWHVGPDGQYLHASQTGRRAGSACAAAPSGASGACSVRYTLDWQLGGSPDRPELVQVRYINGLAADGVRWQLGD